MDENIAWAVAIAAGAGILVAIFSLARGLPGILRGFLVCLAAVWLLLPWPIQVVQGHYAPAFAVALFEGLFQTDGNARAPLVALGLASVGVVVLFAALAVVARLRRG
jgi:hypothetical protein